MAASAYCIIYLLFDDDSPKIPFSFFSCLKGCRKLNLAANAYEEIQNTARIDLEKNYKFRHFDFTLVKTSDVDFLKALIINSMLKNK